MFDFDKSFTIFLDNFDLFWYGTKITIILALVGKIAGLIIGLLFGEIRATTIDIKDKKIILRIIFKREGKLMYKIYKDSKMIGCVKNPVYVLKAGDVYVLTDEKNASYINYKDTLYNILGLAHDKDKDTVMLIEEDDGQLVFQSKDEINRLILTNIM